MITIANILVVLALWQQPSIRVDTPRVAFEAADRSVQYDSAAIVEAQWNARLARDSSDRAAMLGLATVALYTYDFARANRLYQRVLLSSHVPDSYTAYADLGLATVLGLRGLWGAAEPWYAQAAAIARAVHEGRAEVEARLSLAAIQGRTKGTAAESRALDSVAAILPPGDAKWEGAYRCQRAYLTARTGGRGAAEEAWAGVALERRAGYPRFEARCLQVVAIDLDRQGDLSAEARILSQAEAIERRIHNRTELGVMLQWHGAALRGLGDFGPARKLLQEAVVESEASGNRSPLGWALINLGEISFGLNDLSTAAQYFARAKALLDTLGDQWGYASAAARETQIALDVGDTARAHRQYREFLSWATRERMPLLIGGVRLGLADVAVRENDWSEAERELAAFRSVLHRGGNTGWLPADFPFYSGMLALRRGDLRRANDLLRTSLALNSSEHDEHYLTQALLAEVALRRGDTVAAETMLREASAELDAWRATLGDRDLKLLAFQVRDQFGGRGPAIASIIAGIAASGRVASAFELAEHRRARTLVDQLTRAAAMRTGGDAPAAVSPRAGNSVMSVAEVERAIPDANTALLEYVVGSDEEPTTLFVVTQWGARAYRLAPIDSLRARIARFAALIEGSGEPRALATELGDALLARALVQLPRSITRLLIVPDGALYQIPFHALAASDGHYLIERYAVATIPSAAVAVALWRRPSSMRPVKLLAFGDPTFADETGAPVLASTRGVSPAPIIAGLIPRLPGTAHEVKEIARFAPDAVVRLRAAASASFLEHTPLDAFRVIHFATHAIMDDGSSARAALVLAPGGGDDEIVSAGDLAALRLNADVVILSACHTAGGVVLGGEGIRGLTAPLLQAGARSVVATEWPVDDKRTVSMVVAFYSALADGLPAADALRAAELSAMRDGAPAREWAAFALVGDPLVRVPLRRPGFFAGLLARWWPW